MNLSMEFLVSSNLTSEFVFSNVKPSFLSPLIKNLISPAQVQPSLVIPIKPMIWKNIAITKQFPVILSFEENVFLATTPITDEYEVGYTQAGALKNFLNNLADHFQWLTVEETNLGIPLEKELQGLRGFIRIVK
jgi:hypothetical protein